MRDMCERLTDQPVTDLLLCVVSSDPSNIGERERDRPLFAACVACSLSVWRGEDVQKYEYDGNDAPSSHKRDGPQNFHLHFTTGLYSQRGQCISRSDLFLIPESGGVVRPSEAREQTSEPFPPGDLGARGPEFRSHPEYLDGDWVQLAPLLQAALSLKQVRVTISCLNPSGLGGDHLSRYQNLACLCSSRVRITSP
ncbi:hypothetical protein BS50DRAFT_373813 [Corynespora cassiicola Philippines]|uniref:Uncharacterized protein n=1 Tax=Corynespora cassiicola Philippines TaxID=1448308 RepID=A0A2T2NN01_CORCC|nr:hypothetical protein BS50DRAFT_373813 [Corynespora cassiicola Philippines]